MSKRLSNLIAGYKKRTEDVLQDAYAETAERVIKRTPVEDGTAVLSWNPTRGNPEGKNIEGDGGSAGEYPQRAKVEAVARSLSVGDSASLGNDLPYIRLLEYGHSDQEPQGMVGVTAAEWQSIVALAAIKAKRG